MGGSGTASLYLRLSGRSTIHSTGLRSQQSDLEDLAASRGLAVVARHVDDGVSGADEERSGLEAWLDDARTRHANHLLAWSLDRVTRAGPHGLTRLLEVLTSEATNPSASTPRFLTFLDDLDSESPDWLERSEELARFAHRERETMRRRLVRYRESNRSAGRVVGGRRAWPFATVEREGGGLGLIPVPEHASAIRWALEYLGNGGSLSGVVREWEARGLVPKGPHDPERPGVWHLSPLRRILAHPNLYGATQHHGELLLDPTGAVRIDPRQAILTVDEWEELQTLLASRSRGRPCTSRGPSLLSGLVVCGTCSRVMGPHRPTVGVAVYRCQGGRGCVRPVSVAMAALEDFVLGMLGDAPRAMRDPMWLAAFSHGGSVWKQNAQLRHLGLGIEVAPGRRGGTPVFDESRITVRMERAV
jgi:site-specific DNA recombinase